MRLEFALLDSAPDTGNFLLFDRRWATLGSHQRNHVMDKGLAPLKQWQAYKNVPRKQGQLQRDATVLPAADRSIAWKEVLDSADAQTICDIFLLMATHI